MNPIARWLIIKKLDGLIKQAKEGNMHTGWMSSEFLVTVLGGCLTVILEALKVDPAITAKIVALVVAYVASRTAIKITNDADGK